MNKGLSEPTKEGLSTVVKEGFLKLKIIETGDKLSILKEPDQSDALDIMCWADDYFAPRLGGRTAPNVSHDEIMECRTPDQVVELYWAAYGEAIRDSDRVEMIKRDVDSDY